MTAPALLPPAIADALDRYHDAVVRTEREDLATDWELLRRSELVAAIAAELARLRNGLAIAESFVRTATAELKEARALLAEVEWGGTEEHGYEDSGFWTEPCCPLCRGDKPNHAAGCRLAALLQGGTP